MQTRTRRSHYALLLSGLLLIAVALLRTSEAFGDVAATGSFSLTIDASGGFPAPTTGQLSWDDQAYEVLGLSTVNLGQDVGTMSLTGISAGFSGLPPTSSFTTTLESDPNTLLSISVLNGTSVCTDPVCDVAGVFNASFVGSVSSLTGSLVGGDAGDLPGPGPTIIYALDGAVSCIFDGLALFNCLGNGALNGFAGENTPMGTDVIVVVETEFFSSLSQTVMPVSIEVTYGEVDIAGTTFVVPTSQAAGSFSSNFAVSLGGWNALFFEVSTDAVVQGPILLCGGYADGNDDGLVDGTPISECDMRILHDEGGTFVDRTLTTGDPLCPSIPEPDLCLSALDLGGIPCIDKNQNQVCGAVANLSSFVIALQTSPFPVPTLPRWGVGLVAILFLVLGCLALWHQRAAQASTSG